jgi:hypothetical protein
MVRDVKEKVKRLKKQSAVGLDLAKFADDTKVGKTVEGKADREKLQSVLNKLCAWTTEWGMAFNVKKCKLMHFIKKKPKYMYVMEGQQLEEVKKGI